MYMYMFLNIQKILRTVRAPRYARAVLETAVLTLAVCAPIYVAFGTRVLACNLVLVAHRTPQDWSR